MLGLAFLAGFLALNPESGAALDACNMRMVEDSTVFMQHPRYEVTVHGVDDRVKKVMVEINVWQGSFFIQQDAGNFIVLTPHPRAPATKLIDVPGGNGLINTMHCGIIQTRSANDDIIWLHPTGLVKPTSPN